MLERIHTADAPAAIGPYNQAIRSGDLIFCSGQIPLDARTGELAAGDIGEQTHVVMANVRAVLAAAGASFADVVKTTVFLVDMADFAAVNAAYGSYFGDIPPARSTVAVAALPRNARVEVEVLARAPLR